MKPQPPDPTPPLPFGGAEWGRGPIRPLVLLGALLLAGCPAKPPVKTHPEPPPKATATPAQPSKTYTVGVTLLTQKHAFYQDLQDAMQKKADELGVDLRIQSCERNVATQRQQIQDFIVKKVDAMVVCPADSAAIGGAIKEANKAAIPVFTADIAADEGEVVCHIASNNEMGGRLIGEYLVKALGGKGEIAIIDLPTVTSVQDRVRGFREAVAKAPGIKIVANPSGGGVRDEAFKQTENVLRAHPNIRAIFGINDDSALGAVAAIEKAGRKDIMVFGYDATEEARKQILSGGLLKADAVQYPRKIGETTIETIVKYLRGEQVPKQIPIEVGVVDKRALEEEGKTM
jgi:ribose transport system substrate-binding protein